jgi:hypothetical protein
MSSQNVKETRAEKKSRNKAEFARLKSSGKSLVKEKQEESKTAAKVPVPSKGDDTFWEDFFSQIESGETLHGFALEHGMSDQVLRVRLRSGDLHERFIEAHQGRAVYHAQSIESMIDRLESGGVESDVARVSIDARKWLATKYYPRMFGERQEVNVKTTDMTKVYIEQLKMLMTDQGKRMRTIEAKSDEKLISHDESAK